MLFVSSSKYCFLSFQLCPSLKVLDYAPVWKWRPLLFCSIRECMSVGFLKQSCRRVYSSVFPPLKSLYNVCLTWLVSLVLYDAMLGTWLLQPSCWCSLALLKPCVERGPFAIALLNESYVITLSADANIIPLTRIKVTYTYIRLCALSYFVWLYMCNFFTLHQQDGQCSKTPAALLCLIHFNQNNTHY